MWLLSLLAAFSLPSPPAASRRQLLSRAAASLPAPAALAFAAEAPSSVRVKGAAEMDLELYARGLLLGSHGRRSESGSGEGVKGQLRALTVGPSEITPAWIATQRGQRQRYPTRSKDIPLVPREPRDGEFFRLAAPVVYLC